MQYIVVGIFAHYTDAEEARLDLELAGIVGNQVELISDINEDARTVNTPGEPSTKEREPHHSRIARLLGLGGSKNESEARDISGEQPNYIGEQEFYANHLKQGGAILIVRATSEPPAILAAGILHDHGARTPGQKDGPAIRTIP
jgi:hypothetical protein